MSKYKEFKRRILSAESLEELNLIRTEYQDTDLSDDDKFVLGCNLRARFGNFAQFSELVPKYDME